MGEQLAFEEARVEEAEPAEDPWRRNFPDPFAAPGELRKLEHIYVFDHGSAKCGECPLQARREMTECLSARPEKWNGLMVVGEGPGANEARLKVPFVGDSGQLLNALFDKAGIEREFTYIGNATLCCPPPSTGEDKRESVHGAVPKCRSRLLLEVQHYQPRVILALGQAALDALTGELRVVTKRIPYDCPTCKNVRTWKLWYCAKCKAPRPEVLVEEHEGLKPQPPETATPCCEAKWQLRKVTCDDCEGKKTKGHSEEHWSSEYKIGEVAGGVFRASTLPIASLLEDPEHTYVVPTYHPSFLLRQPSTKSQKKIGGQFLASASLAHYRKARRLLESDPQFAFTWFSPVDPAEMEAYWAPSEKAYAVDTETDAKDPLEVTDIRCIGIGYEDDSCVMVVNTMGLPSDHPRVAAVRAFLEDPTKKKIFQNGLYDVPVIKRVWQCEVRGYVEDTLAAHNAVAPDEPHNLAHIGFLYTDTPPWKPPKYTKKGGVAFDTVEELLEYCGRDVRCTALSMQQLRVELERELDEGVRRGRLDQVHALDVAKFRLAIEMQDRGMPVDRKRMLEIGTEAQWEKEQALRQMREFVGRVPDHLVAKDAGADRDAFALNPNKPNQMAWALFDPNGPCKFTPTAFTPTDQPSTEKGALLDFAEHPFVDAFFRFKQNQKIKSTWVDGMPIGDDGRLRPAWNPSGARTGRWTSSPNFQNWPKWLRAMVVALEGRAFVGADFDQLELRILAALSGDEELIRRCRDADERRKLEPEWDPHSYVSALTFGAAFTDLLLKDHLHDKDNKRCACQTCTRKQYRDITKRTVYGLNYGAGAKKIREAIYDAGYDGPAVTLEMIDRVVEMYFKAFPRVPVWRDRTLAEACETAHVRDAFLNRIRVFPLGQVDATVAYNFPIQASAASVVDYSTMQLYERLPLVDPTAFIFAQVHDAVYVECAKDKAAAVEALMNEVLPCEIRVAPDAPWMPLTAKAQIANDWMAAA